MAAPALIAFESVARSGTAVAIDDAGVEIAFVSLAGGDAEAGLVPMLDALLRRVGVPRAFAVAVGPGSFAGLRVGLIAARTLAWIDGVPVRPVGTLAARAAQAGPGLWWCLMPLTRDTTLHGLYRVDGRLTVEVVSPPTATRDDAMPDLHPRTALATAVGPALTVKPGLAQRWCPGVGIGSAAAVDARGVVAASAQVSAVAWDRVLPDYVQEAAPVLQRQARDAAARAAKESTP